jgi:hypothetical protein
LFATEDVVETWDIDLNDVNFRDVIGNSRLQSLMTVHLSEETAIAWA